jgi:site-specific DNA-methyltransferase (adenine-specific)
MFVAKPLAEQVGFKFWKPLVWDKRTIGMGYHYRARYELILFFEKGKRKLNDLAIADVISHPRIRGGYPAEKPSAVSEILIRQRSEPGELVIDPFMGSGSVGAAAIGLGRSFKGTDVCVEAVSITEARLREAGGVPRC